MLTDWGWNDHWAEALARVSVDGGVPARVVGQERDRWAIQMEGGPGTARATPGDPRAERPVVGDWIVVERGPLPADPWSVVAVLPRRAAFSRGAAGTGSSPQVLAANVDRAWVVHGLDAPLNPRRLERYLALAWESGATPEIILTKADLSSDPEMAAAAAGVVAPGVSVRTVSSASPAALEALRDVLRPGSTVVLLGPSGAGKSTLVNLLSGEDRTATSPVREGDRKGRHTTTRRELHRLPGGALLMDTPGIRELRVWELGEGLEQAFPEIAELAEGCRFGDCRHESEPGCAVRKAAEEGRLDPERLASYRKLEAEADYQARKTDHRARQAALSDHKAALKSLKYHPKYRSGE